MRKKFPHEKKLWSKPWGGGRPKKRKKIVYKTPLETRTCAYVVCGKKFKTRKVGKIYCSKGCAGRNMAPETKARRNIIDRQRQPSVEEKKQLVAFNGAYLTLNNYKEPLKEIEKKEGFGYYGALCSTLDGSLVQCHLCGELFQHLPFHIRNVHKLTTEEYRDRFMLAKKTALCSEEYRQKMKLAFMERFQEMSAEEKSAFKQRLKERAKKGREIIMEKYNGKTFQGNSLETKNKRGVCPDQLLDKIKECALELGHTPSKYNFIEYCESQRYVHLIYKTFGSWSNALKMLKMESPTKIHKKGGHRYNDEELLEYLRIFAQENNKVPTYTDFKRGLLPAYDCYTRRWGSIENARQESGLYELVDDPSWGRWNEKKPAYI